jgi:hypothetical protein
VSLALPLKGQDDPELFLVTTAANGRDGWKGDIADEALFLRVSFGHNFRQNVTPDRTGAREFLGSALDVGSDIGSVLIDARSRLTSG